MLSRLTYTFRETWASFRRNMTLTVAAIITSAVSLLIFGLTLLMQRGFDNLLVAWEGDVEMIIYVNPGATDPQRTEIENALGSAAPGRVVHLLRHDVLARGGATPPRRRPGDAGAADRRRRSRPSTRSCRTDATDVDTLRQLRESLGGLPNVRNIVLADEQLDVISKLQGFVGLYTVILSITLLFAAILLIWNTIRTAMFARRREIEVMKLVGATDWFIRIPFMLEGLIQGFIGGLAACGGLWLINNRWTAGVKDFPAQQRLRRPRRDRRLPAALDVHHHGHRHDRRRHRLGHRRLPLLGRVSVPRTGGLRVAFVCSGVGRGHAPRCGPCDQWRSR